MPESAPRLAMPGPSPAPPAASAEPEPGRRRWLILAVVGVAQLMVVLDIIANRIRGSAYLGALTAGIGLIGAFLLITYYLQDVQGFSPLRTGLAFLAILFAAGSVATALLFPRRR